MAVATYRSTITADRSITFSGASYTPDDGGSLAGNVADAQIPSFWDVNGGTYRVDELFFGFDLADPTSGDAPAAGATINSVTLNMNLYEHGSTARTKEVYVYDWGASVDTGDWRTVSQLQTLYDSGDGLFASYAIPSGWGGAEGAHDFTEGNGAAGAVAAAIGGTLRLIMVDAAHRAGSTPSGRGYSSWNSASNGTESNRPLLTVDYTAGGAEAAYSGRGIGRGIARGIMRCLPTLDPWTRDTSGLLVPEPIGG